MVSVALAIIMYMGSAFCSDPPLPCQGKISVYVHKIDHQPGTNKVYATIYADHEGRVPLSNPFQADQYGNYQFGIKLRNFDVCIEEACYEVKIP